MRKNIFATKFRLFNFILWKIMLKTIYFMIFLNTLLIMTKDTIETHQAKDLPGDEIRLHTLTPFF